MNRNVKTITTLSISLAIAIPLWAQPSKKAKPTGVSPLQVTVTLVNDRRTTGHFKQLDIGLRLPGIPSEDVAASRVVIRSAVDDTGQTLLKSDQDEPQFEQNSRMISRQGKDSAPTSINLTLNNPARTATKLKELSGEIELYMPDKDPNSTAVFPKFLSSAGKPLSHRALKASGVEVTLISKAQLEADKKRLGEKKRQEAKAEGLDAQSMEWLVTSFLQSLFTPEEGDVLLRVKDPNARIHEFVLIDAAGEVKRVSSRVDDSGVTVLSIWGEKPAENWSLRVSLKTPKTIVRHSFKLTDIPLP